ncbi:MAG: SpoIID/LytB domain-containing protein [Planctomycetota bacterium]|nr:SpoIID/LytB domain-containing protein [Planctomycetota bacterium]
MTRTRQRSDAIRVISRPEVPGHVSSRRAFIAQLAVIAVAAPPAVLTACGSDSSSGDKTANSGPQRGESGAQGDARRRLRPVLPPHEPVVRVRVFKARGVEPAIRIGEAQQWLRLGADSLETPEVVLRGPLDARLGPKSFSIIDANGIRAPTEGTMTLDIATMPDADGPLKLQQRRYPGPLRLVARTDVGAGAFDVINVVDLEAYLPGVVAGELYDHWRMQTRAAQAIAARSFACSEHAFFGARRAYDMTDTAASQVYLGSVRHQDSIDAVAMTRGVVLADEGLLVPGYYCSCCGGLAAVAVDAIGSSPVNDIAPLRGHTGRDVCWESRIARWTIERPVAVMTRRLIAYGKRRRRDDLANLAQIASIEATARNRHGRPRRYTVTDINRRTAELSAEKLQSAANYAGPGLSAPKRRLWSSHITVTFNGPTATLQGRGYGHGVGMCQYGAEALARSGQNHQAILAWYYPGAGLVQAYA